MSKSTSKTMSKSTGKSNFASQCNEYKNKVEIINYNCQRDALHGCHLAKREVTCGI